MFIQYYRLLILFTVNLPKPVHSGSTIKTVQMFRLNGLYTCADRRRIFHSFPIAASNEANERKIKREKLIDFDYCSISWQHQLAAICINKLLKMMRLLLLLLRDALIAVVYHQRISYPSACFCPSFSPYQLRCGHLYTIIGHFLTHAYSADPFGQKRCIT